MLQFYLTDNFMTLMLLAALSVVLFVNRREQIPASRYFHVVIILLLVLTFVDTFEEWAAGEAPIRFFTQDPDRIVLIRTSMAAIGYILRPVIILIQVFITSPKMGRYKPLLAIPAVANALIYITAFTGSKAAFWISRTNHWYRGELGLSIYFTMMFYVFMLAMFSIIYFRTENIKRSAIVFLIVVQAVIVSILEGTNTLPGYTSPIMALGMLEYYFYLSVIYQNEIRETLAEHQLRLTRQRMTLLRNQIQPHFIFNSLSVIRSLAKRDAQKAVSGIDSFSDYLKAHIYYIQDDEMISFEKELGHVKAYLALVQADSMRNVDVVYDLPVTDFMIPPLTLEPIVENAIKHGIGRDGGQITIATDEDDSAYIIKVSDSGRLSAGANPGSGMTEKETERLGVGIDNTRTRLKMQCNGTLDMKIDKEAGSTVKIRIPKPLSADS